MDDYNSETDSDYTSYWRDWVGEFSDQTLFSFFPRLFSLPFPTFDFFCFAPSGVVDWNFFVP